MNGQVDRDMIEENIGYRVSEVYEAVQAYLSARLSSTAERLKLKKPENNKEFNFSMDNKTSGSRTCLRVSKCIGTSSA